MTPGMTADKARNMLLLEEERRTKTHAQTQGDPIMGFTATRPFGKRSLSRKASESLDGPCSTCGKPHKENVCWKLHPDLAPEWLRE